ncbi:MAG: glycogen debranching protein GlgX [Alphaproteobacteria bacterium]|nr:glycogen debranching protein GlgX [Alphaproteobacteria bacterium]
MSLREILAGPEPTVEHEAPRRLGAFVVDGGVQFAVSSLTAARIWVCLFDDDDRETDRIEMERGSGGLFYVLVAGVGAGQRYGLRADGEYAPARGLWFDPEKLLVDPYARHLDRRFVAHPALSLIRPEATDTADLVPKAIVGKPSPAVNLVLDPPPPQPAPNLIYEINVRGFSMNHPGVRQNWRGTVSALGEPAVLEHFVSIGADCIELMPIAGFIDDRHLAGTGLHNAWGYNPVTHFAPDPGLCPGGPDEMRTLCATLRKAGLSVVLDVVFNHSGEGDDLGPTLSMRGLDNLTYFRHFGPADRLELVNDTGTGNTLATERPLVQRLVLDCLRYWATEIGVSGFRFDLATSLGRTADGFEHNSVLLEAIRRDPVLGGLTLIAEPWDMGPDGYQLGAFGRGFYEWNDKYRDDVRRFWRGDDGWGAQLATRLAGSADIFGSAHRTARASVNFVAAHDGFTLRDLVSFSHKQNLANGEDNRDGHDANFSWNCGEEGLGGSAEVEARRLADRRALLATLAVSKGTPMLAAGDEFGRTQSGNNNAYAQDNETVWLDWANAEKDLAGFFGELMRLRARSPCLGGEKFLTGTKGVKGWRDVVWLGTNGVELTTPEWERADLSCFGMALFADGQHLAVWFNRDAGRRQVVLPELAGWAWQRVLCSHPEVPPAFETGAKQSEVSGRSVTVFEVGQEIGA